MKNTQQLTSSPVLAGGMRPLTPFSSSRLFLKSSLFLNPADLQIFFTYLKYSNSFVFIFQPGWPTTSNFDLVCMFSSHLNASFFLILWTMIFWVDTKSFGGDEETRRGSGIIDFWVAIKTNKSSVSHVQLITNIYSGFDRRYVSCAIFLPESNFRTVHSFSFDVMIYYPSDLRHSNFLVWMCMDGTTSSTFNRS